jgi:saccharopine dehydrogenase (NAD+, L-lysine-forming)
MIHFGIIREGKVPPDERVPLTPEQIKQLQEEYKQIRFTVQRSAVRRIEDAEYEALGIEMSDEVSGADVLLGVKEVPKSELIPHKTYLFFSHTIKQQPYNKALLQTVLEKKIRLVDWECLRDAQSRRLIGFGRYAGIVGTYNGLRLLGMREGSFSLKKAHDCADRTEMESEMKKIVLGPIKILLTGRGKVAKGSMEVLDALRIKRVGIREFLNQSFDQAVYCQVNFSEYFKRKDGGPFDVKDFYAQGGLTHKSDFMRFAKVSDVYIAGHFWDSKSPFLFTREDVKHPDFRIRLVADISCDIDGPVATTLRPSTIEDPFYGYDPMSEREVKWDTSGSIAVMAVDNLPCELPRDASKDFGRMFIHSVLPSFLNGDKHGILTHATIAQNGSVQEAFSYLKEWVEA